jgi:hypothetical protein
MIADVWKGEWVVEFVAFVELAVVSFQELDFL